MNSSYAPQNSLDHESLIRASVIYERIWLLYSLYYDKQDLMFEHIFAEHLVGE